MSGCREQLCSLRHHLCSRAFHFRHHRLHIGLILVLHCLFFAHPFWISPLESFLRGCAGLLLLAIQLARCLAKLVGRGVEILRSFSYRDQSRMMYREQRVAALRREINPPWGNRSILLPMCWPCLPLYFASSVELARSAASPDIFLQSIGFHLMRLSLRDLRRAHFGRMHFACPRSRSLRRWHVSDEVHGLRVEIHRKFRNF